MRQVQMMKIVMMVLEEEKTFGLENRGEGGDPVTRVLY
jgi:hypothetical protein